MMKKFRSINQVKREYFPKLFKKEQEERKAQQRKQAKIHRKRS